MGTRLRLDLYCTAEEGFGSILVEGFLGTKEGGEEREKREKKGKERGEKREEKRREREKEEEPN